jgi:hypothetical protein
MAKKKQKKQQPGQQFLSPEQYMKQRVRSLEMGACYVSEDMTDCGEGHVIITRRHTGGRISVAMYLVDTYCLGVKDTFFKLRLEDYELENMLDRIPNIRECSYEEAHSWVYGAIAWAEEAGIEPDKSFAVTKYMLEEDNDGIPLIEYEFGRDGKHLLVANNNLEASRYLPLLKKNLGEGNFEFTIKTDFDDVDMSDEAIFDRWEHASETPLFKRYGPSTEYTYQHPDYPQTLQLDSPEWLYSELQKTDNALYLPEELTSRILAQPRDIVRHDLEQIVLYHIGKTCDGIPFYLSLIDTKESLGQNVDRLCFARGGALRLEFDELYNALFTHADKYTAVVRLLAERRYGMTSLEISEATRIDGERLTMVLRNLERCDFIMKFRYYGKKKQDIKLTDFYTLFFIKYIELNMDLYDEQWWQHHAISHSVESWQGLTFELLCLIHIRQIRQALNIGGVATEVSAWFDQVDKKKTQRGSQIDLIIERADRISHLCEMKFSQGEFRITADYEERLRNRMTLFREKTKNKMSLVHTFVTAFGVANGKHSSLVHSEVTMDGLFLQ